jgi:thiol:disulfide interchange protein DsbD
MTCKTNEKRAFSDQAVLDRLAELDVILIKADNTKNDRVLMHDLSRAGRANLPVWLIYPADPEKPPILLEEWINPGDLLEALEKASH